MTLRRRAVAVRAWLGRGGHPSALSSLFGPSRAASEEADATMTSADFCSGLREAYSSPQSISVARHFPGYGADLPG